ncbi:TRAP transporter substrate-binding protein [Rhodoferax sp.]|uniref:TRAP transporter substrate-binding protein n=1 Tax=Rhodoferax sp. TaxID=50421 RepID=UPI0025F9C5CC|nr:TRAP transporter substrate-binding protein [Rhodoferax sp.]MCM2339824.1 TRAP transporter substrate-binding protein [Rhodoferax sp.]
MFSLNKNLVRAVTLSAAALACSSVLHAADVTLKLGHIANEENSWHKAALKFADEVKTLTNGKVEVKVFPNDSLGKEMDLINGMQLGTADMTITGESLQNWAPKAALLAIPYAFKDMAEMDKAVNGPLGAEIKKEVAERAKVIALAYFARGPRNLTSKTPVKSVNDVKGLKMRVPNVPVFMQFWRGVGAQPTPMAFGEVFTSLQTGVIDAQENPLALIKSASFFEVQKYVNRTEHVRSWIYLAIGEKSFNKLNAEQKKAVQEAAQRAQVYERTLMLADEQKLEAELKAKGMTFVETDQTGFAKKAKEAVLAAAKEEIKPIIQQLYAD